MHRTHACACVLLEEEFFFFVFFFFVNCWITLTVCGKFASLEASTCERDLLMKFFFFLGEKKYPVESLKIKLCSESSTCKGSIPDVRHPRRDSRRSAEDIAGISIRTIADPSNSPETYFFSGYLVSRNDIWKVILNSNCISARIEGRKRNFCLGFFQALKAEENRCTHDNRQWGKKLEEEITMTNGLEPRKWSCFHILRAEFSPANSGLFPPKFRLHPPPSLPPSPPRDFPGGSKEKPRARG